MLPHIRDWERRTQITSWPLLPLLKPTPDTSCPVTITSITYFKEGAVVTACAHLCPPSEMKDLQGADLLCSPAGKCKPRPVFRVSVTLWSFANLLAVSPPLPTQPLGCGAARRFSNLPDTRVSVCNLPRGSWSLHPAALCPRWWATYVVSWTMLWVHPGLASEAQGPVGIFVWERAAEIPELWFEQEQ